MSLSVEDDLGWKRERLVKRSLGSAGRHSPAVVDGRRPLPSPPDQPAPTDGGRAGTAVHLWTSQLGTPILLSGFTCP